MPLVLSVLITLIVSSISTLMGLNLLGCFTPDRRCRHPRAKGFHNAFASIWGMRSRINENG